MMETMPMACMQQFFQSAPPIPRPGCRGNTNPQSAVAMKSLSPAYENALTELDDCTSSLYSNFFDIDHYSKMNYNFESTLQPCYNTDQVTPATSDCSSVTAFNKPLNILTDLDETWQGRHPSSWDHGHLTQWLLRVCERNNLDYERVRTGQYNWDSVTGSTLLELNKQGFVEKFPYGGMQIYEAFQEAQLNCNHVENYNGFCQYDSTYGWPGADLDPAYVNSNNNNNRLVGNLHEPPSNLLHPLYQMKIEIDSDVDSNQSLYNNRYPQESNVTNGDSSKLLRRRPGRPPNKEKKNKSKNGQRNSRLWEFIRDLLLDSKTCPSLLKWENVEEGIFRFVQSDRVARLWGERKCNPRMTYEKLSRAMRYYYKSQVFLPVIGRRLVYRFGPNATGWRPNHSCIS